MGGSGHLDRGFASHLRIVAVSAMIAYALAAGCVALTFAAPRFGMDPNRVNYLYVPPQAYLAAVCALLGIGMSVWTSLLGTLSSARRRSFIWCLIFAALLALCVVRPVLLGLQLRNLYDGPYRGTLFFNIAGIALLAAPLAALAFSLWPMRRNKLT